MPWRLPSTGKAAHVLQNLQISHIYCTYQQLICLIYIYNIVHKRQVVFNTKQIPSAQTLNMADKGAKGKVKEFALNKQACRKAAQSSSNYTLK